MKLSEIKLLNEAKGLDERSATKLMAKAYDNIDGDIDLDSNEGWDLFLDEFDKQIQKYYDKKTLKDFWKEWSKKGMDLAQEKFDYRNIKKFYQYMFKVFIEPMNRK